MNRRQPLYPSSSPARRSLSWTPSRSPPPGINPRPRPYSECPYGHPLGPLRLCAAKGEDSLPTNWGRWYQHCAECEQNQWLNDPTPVALLPEHLRHRASGSADLPPFPPLHAAIAHHMNGTPRAVSNPTRRVIGLRSRPPAPIASRQSATPSSPSPSPSPSQPRPTTLRQKSPPPPPPTATSSQPGGSRRSCLSPTCLTRQNTRRVANAACGNAIGPLCATCCRARGGCGVHAGGAITVGSIVADPPPSSQATMDDPIASSSQHVSSLLLPPPSQPSTRREPFQLKQQYSRPMKDFYGGWFGAQDQKTMRAAAADLELEKARRVQRVVQLVVWFQAGVRPLQANVETKSFGTFCFAEHTSVLDATAINLGGFIEVLDPKGHWVMQDASLTIKVPAEATIYVRKVGISTPECPGLDSVLRGLRPTKAYRGLPFSSPSSSTPSIPSKRPADTIAQGLAKTPRVSLGAPPSPSPMSLGYASPSLVSIARVSHSLSLASTPAPIAAMPPPVPGPSTPTPVQRPSTPTLVLRPSTPTLVLRPSTPTLVLRPSPPTLVPRPPTPTLIPPPPMLSTTAVVTDTKFPLYLFSKMAEGFSILGAARTSESRRQEVFGFRVPRQRYSDQKKIWDASTVELREVFYAQPQATWDEFRKAVSQRPAGPPTPLHASHTPMPLGIRAVAVAAAAAANTTDTTNTTDTAATIADAAANIADTTATAGGPGDAKPLTMSASAPLRVVKATFDFYEVPEGWDSGGIHQEPNHVEISLEGPFLKQGRRKYFEQMTSAIDGEFIGKTFPPPICDRFDIWQEAYYRVDGPIAALREFKALCDQMGLNIADISWWPTWLHVAHHDPYSGRGWLCQKVFTEPHVILECSGTLTVGQPWSQAVEALNAFSHFSFIKSKGTSVVVDIQAFESQVSNKIYIFDCLTHTQSTAGNHPLVGDGGQEAIDQFVHFHLCNYICSTFPSLASVH